MRKVVWLGIPLFIACAGKAPHGPGDVPDAPTGDDSGDGDGGLTTAQMVSGKTIDYFANLSLKATDLQTDGIDPPAMTTSSADDATYSLQVPVGSKLYVIASRTSYRATRNVAIAMADMPVSDDLYAMSTADVTRQYTTLGKTPTAGTSVVFAELRKDDGTPLTGIPLANVQLLDSNNQPVPNVIYAFVGSVGDVDSTVTTATAYGTPPRARVALLDVPVGTYTLAVTYPGTNGNIQDNTPITSAADGAVLALSGGAPAAGSSATDPHFAQDIYPRLQVAANGGLGCANCHTATGPASILPYDAAPDTVLANMRAATGVINTTTPSASYFVEHPLYKAPPATQDHPNATFLDTNDPDYKLFLLWITNGTKP